VLAGGRELVTRLADVKASRCCPAAGWWNGPSAGSRGADAWHARLMAARLAGEDIEPHGPIETEAARRLADDLNKG
jgi:hypothetical protein